MKNPYEEPLPDDTVSLAKPMRWFGLVVFLGFVALTPLLGWKGHFVGGTADSDASLRERLRSFENRFADSGLFGPWRQQDQARLVKWFSEGNRKVLIGKDGWLFYRPDVETVVGKGPYYVEPKSVARDPGLDPWQQPIPVIKDFAKQLKERGIQLIFVPVPTKAMVHAEKIGAKRSAYLPSEWNSLLRELRGAEVKVLDMMSGGLPNTSSYLQQDTHWTPGTMSSVMARVEEMISATEARSHAFRATELPGRRSYGDLVEMLGSEPVKSLFETEEVDLVRAELTTEAQGGETIVLLGDSFVNIYEDPSLGFAIEGEDRIRAGFASQLAALHGSGVETIASNGGGATVVRKRFAESLQNRKTPPETVVWVLSARDIFLSEIPARRARVKWEFVELPEAKLRAAEAESGEVVIAATLREKSRIGDESEQKTAAYQSAVYSTMFDEVEVLSGEMSKKEAWVFLWAAKKKKLVDTGRLEVGKRYRLQLVPFPKEGEVSTATQLDDFFRLDLPRLFAAEVEEVE